MAKNKVILTGFMGCGKSTIGRILAEKRGQELLDTDHYIEQKQGRSISDIFATQGEEAFRDMETEALRELIQKQEPLVIALGGGLPIGGNLYGEEPVRQRALLRGERNRELLAELGYVFYLKITPGEVYGQIAVQGPNAETVVEEVLGIACKELTFYTVKTIGDVIVSRTGYTGEDGFEIYASHNYICDCWDKLMESGRCKPCGLGCRDTLRFEVGLPLYGDELSADISPVMAGLSMFCKLDKEEFVGKDALVDQKTNGVAQKLVGIELEGKAIPRHGYTVLKDGEPIGEVTTGYHSISTDKSVCMALVKAEYGKLGTPLEVQIRKKTFPGVVVKKRFYDKHYKK